MTIYGRGKIFGKDGQYPRRERRLLIKWWKNHILLQHGEDWNNVALLNDLLSLCKALRFEDASKWNATMQETLTCL